MTGESPVPLHRHHAESNPTGKRLAILTLTALGVVYGDIGTSPLYAIKETFKPEYGLQPNLVNVYGILSMIVWSLILIVSVKYVGFILRADNRGEGGVFALLALVLQLSDSGKLRVGRTSLIMMGLFGGAFLYGDGIITPAISVLGAVEGLEIIAPRFESFVVPAAFVIIATLFAVQYLGTARVGGAFGWIMLAWFFSIAAIGVSGIVQHPEILGAANPMHALEFFINHPMRSFVVLGAVVLVVTGGEALYADMGHFGRKPIRVAWFGLVLPSLLLNYFGQGALLIKEPKAVENPFYMLAPQWFLIPLLIVATLAAIVASQALISGAFSLTQQAVQLGYTPRVTIVHTSKQEAGQIYIPEVNVLLAVGTLLLVATFRSSTALGAAYGVAVTGTMAITNILFFAVARGQWEWSAAKAGAFVAFFLAIDLAFFSSNLLKVPHGGWVPLLIAVVTFTVMTTWKRGRMLLRTKLLDRTLPIASFVESLGHGGPVRVPGTAIFMTSESEGTPVVLLHHLKHNKVLHEKVILLSILAREVPEVPASERITVEPMQHGIYRVKAAYGFMETPNVEDIRARLQEAGIKTKRMDTTYYLGREELICANGVGMSRWRKKLFAVMARNARSATQYFGIPANRVVELGTQIEF
ncbi:MAG: potassium transporter Kup [Gemmatimonadaceae bacterium]|nr:potassium transporter Kup [Gemmatimonadaceae bacterium]